MTSEVVPFNRPYVTSNALAYLQQSLASGHLSGDGPMTQNAVKLISGITKGGQHLLTPSCTHALELACRLLNLGPGDEVILPSFNFPSAATAVALCGATPVFVDVDFQTKNLTPETIRQGITERTRAIIVVHYAGVIAPMSEIVAMCAPLGIRVIEDSAHALGVDSALGMAGSFGVMSAYSFHETKNLQCGEGGSLQINDPDLVERAEILREKGTNRRKFFRGQVAKYSWVDHGSSWLLADPLAALLCSQLEEFAEIQLNRVNAWNHYFALLASWAIEFDFEPPWQPIDQDVAAHMFYLVAPSLSVRENFIAHLRKRGIGAVFHYQPLHSSKAGKSLGRNTAIVNTNEISDRLVRLPLFAGLSTNSIELVCDAVTSYRP